MKLVTAILSSQHLDEAREALLDIGISGLTISRLCGEGPASSFARHGAPRSPESGDTRFKLEILATDRLVESVVASIIGTLGPGAAYDARIMIFGPEDAVRIRTLEIGEGAVD